MILTLLMLISHTITDFILQTESMVKNKSNMKFSGYIKHGFGLFVTSLPIFLVITLNSLTNLFIVVFSIILIHLIIDYVKGKVRIILDNKNYTKKVSVLIFSVDQLLHIIIIMVFTSKIPVEFKFINTSIIGNVFVSRAFVYHNLKNIFIVLYISFSGAYLIPLMFDIIYEKIDDYTEILNEPLKEDIGDEKLEVFIDEVKTGKWIGVLERILIVMLLLSNQLTSIGFIIAIKSLARFKMMENKIFSEYFLLGTLMSLVYTFLIYSILQNIFI